MSSSTRDCYIESANTALRYSVQVLCTMSIQRFITSYRYITGMSSPPFIDRESGELDLSQVRAEVFPLAGLILLFGSLALLVFLIMLLAAGNSLLGGLLTVVTQFILAVGTGIVLMYVIARGIQLADE